MVSFLEKLQFMEGGVEYCMVLGKKVEAQMCYSVFSAGRLWKLLEVQEEYRVVERGEIEGGFFREGESSVIRDERVFVWWIGSQRIDCLILSLDQGRVRVCVCINWRCYYSIKIIGRKIKSIFSCFNINCLGVEKLFVFCFVIVSFFMFCLICKVVKFNYVFLI